MNPTQAVRVLQICEASSAGVGRHTIDLTEGLLAKGCDVHLLYSRARIDDAFERGVARLPSGRSHVIEMAREPTAGDAAAMLAVCRYVASHGPFDLVHGHSSKGGAIARLAGAASRKPVIYTPHCISTMVPSFGRVKNTAFKLVEAGLALLTRRILAASQEEYDHIRSLGVAASRLRLVPHGIQRLPLGSKQEVRAALGLSQDQVIIGFVGRLSEQKNPALAIRAFARLAAQQQKVRLAIIGSGELEAECRRLAAELRVDDRIDWLGYRPGYESMPAFDVLLVPSRYEGLPYVMLEALTVGLPLVITPVGGVKLVIDDGKNGFVVPHDDVVAMSEAIGRLAADANWRARVSRAALAKSEDFSIDAMVNRILWVYRECLN